MPTPPNSIAWPKVDTDLVFLLAAGVWLIEMFASAVLLVNPGLMYVSLVMFILTAVFGRAVKHWAFGEGAVVIRGVRARAGEVSALLWFVGTVLGVLGSWMALVILGADAQAAARTPAVFIVFATIACVGAIYCLLVAVVIAKVNRRV